MDNLLEIFIKLHRAKQQLLNKIHQLFVKVHIAKDHLKSSDYPSDFIAALTPAINDVQVADDAVTSVDRQYFIFIHVGNYVELYTEHNQATSLIKETKLFIDTVELQKNARVLGEAHRAFHTKGGSPISDLPKEIGMVIAKLGLFHSDSLSEKEKIEVSERAFRKPPQC